MPAGYSGTPLVRKLGIKEGMRVLVVQEPEGYWSLLGTLPAGVERIGPRARNVDFVHGFVTRHQDLAKRLPRWRDRITQNDMIWVSWPKKSSGVPSNVTEDVVRGEAFDNQLVDVKVCAVDEIWSGLKLVIRLKDRR